MKRTPLKRSQKPIPKKRATKRNTKGIFDTLKKESKTDEWTRVRKELQDTFYELGIDYCELRLEGCMGKFGLGFAHSLKRGLIAAEGEKREREIREVVKACSHCHHIIEYPTKELLQGSGETGHEYMYRMVREAIQRREESF